MSTFKSAAYALGAIGAALLTACSGGTQSPAVSAVSTTNVARSGASPLRHDALDAFITVRQPGQAHPDPRKSWISPDVKRATRLAFVTDLGAGDISIFSLPNFKLKGTLTGFSQPQGMCSDNKGNVYVANTEAFDVVEITRAGSIVNTWDDAYGYPVGCAVDPATGNLAVSDIFGITGSGQVLIFSAGSHTPQVLSNSAQYFYYFVGYGPNSELWTSGRTIYGDYMASACNTSSCNTIDLTGGTIYFPGAVQWDGRRGNWVLFDQTCNATAASCSYPVSASGVLGTATTYDNYNGNGVCGMAQGVIAANNLNFVIGSDASCTSSSAAIGRWGYPAGGTPTNFATFSSPYAVPGGIAISTK
ncbi:MAG: hypothetical protein WAL67_05950 [Candidatus Cybelea sp.]